MNTASLVPTPAAPPLLETSPSKSSGPTLPSKTTDPTSDLVTASETYTFAGETHLRTVQVPRDSTQAEVQVKSPTTPALQQKLGPDGQVLIRPWRRRSAFDPNPTGVVKGLPDPNNPTRPTADKNKNKGTKHKYVIPKVKQPVKLNVVDKSKLDWEIHVKAIGARDELEAAKKRKDDFLGRKDFLDRVEGREDEARSAVKTR